MGETPVKNPVGRPPKPMDFDAFEKMCQLHCTPEEIAGFFHITRPTLYDKVAAHYGDEFPTIYKNHCAGGKMSLRRFQLKQAEKSAAMAIWLGKQYLGQTDTPQQTETPQANLVDMQNRLMAVEAENAKLKAANDLLNKP